MDVSIVIVSYNVAKFIDHCLISIKKETSCEYEIIVVDNDSKDNSIKLVRTNHPEVKIILNHCNVGFAKANNKGFRIANGRYIFMLNPDTVLQEGTVDRLVRFMDENPEIGMCGPKVLNPDFTIQLSCHHFPTLSMAIADHLQLRRFFPRNKFFGREHMTYWNYDEIKEVDWITGCSLMMKREAIEDVGFLDENYFMYSEECDLSYRMTQNHWKTVFYPHSTIIHYGGQSSLTQKDQTVHENTITTYLFDSRYYFFKKNYGLWKELLLRFLDLLYYGLVYIKNNILFTKKNRKEMIILARSALKAALNKS